MNRIKNRLKGGFTVAPNELINNREIDARARFIYVYMASKPDGWKFNNTDLMNACGIKDPRTFKKLMDQLVNTGWIEKTPQNREGGKFSTFDYIINSEPICKKCTTVEDSPICILTDTQNLRYAKNAQHSNKEYIVIKNNNKEREDAHAKENSNKKPNTTKQPKRKEKINPNSAPPLKKESQPDSLKTVKAYLAAKAVEKGRNINTDRLAEKFWLHYENNGWRISGRTKMKNWKLAAQKWLLDTPDAKPQQSINPHSSILGKRLKLKAI